MFKLPIEFVLIFFKFTGLSCFHYHEKRLRTSQFSAVFNLLKVLLSIILTACITFSTSFDDKLFSDDAVNQSRLSNFSKILLLSSDGLVYFTSAYLSCTIWFNRNAIFSILNDMHLDFQQLDREIIFTFHERASRSFLFLFPIIFFYFTSQVLLLKLNWLTPLVCIVLMYPYLQVISFFGVVGWFSSFLVASFDNFELETKLLLTKKTNSEDLRRLILKFDKIKKLSDEFNRIFGSLLTLMTCLIVVEITFDVSFIQNIKEKKKIFFFQFYHALQSFLSESSAQYILVCVATIAPDILLLHFLCYPGEAFATRRKLLIKLLRSEIVKY